MYAQQEVLKDLIAARLSNQAPLFFEAEAMRIENYDTAPKIHYQHDGQSHEIIL